MKYFIKAAIGLGFKGDKNLYSDERKAHYVRFPLLIYKW